MNRVTIHNHLTGEAWTTTPLNAWDAVENVKVPGWSYQPLALVSTPAEEETTDGVPQEAEAEEQAEEVKELPAPVPADVKPVSVADLSREELHELLEDRGIEFDKRWGLARLHDALDVKPE